MAILGGPVPAALQTGLGVSWKPGVSLGAGPAPPPPFLAPGALCDLIRITFATPSAQGGEEHWL